MDIVELVQAKRRDLDYDMETDSFKTITQGEVVLYVKNGIVTAPVDVPKICSKGEYNYFDFLCTTKFKDNAVATLTHVQYRIYSDKIPYICVGTDYYKVISSIDRYNVKRTKLKLWKLPEIKPYHGKDVIFEIPRYDDFCLEPNNIDYEPIVNNMYNQHSEFSHQPDMYGGSFKWTKQLLKHIFGDQYEQGLKYLQVLYMHPKKALPILVLVSEERQTGKSTFIDWLTVVFGENMVVANPKDIGSDFNSSYADKNIIGIEESRFDSVQTTEKLKNLATQKKILVNPKHQQPYSLPFFGKLIITSNDEHKFSKVDDKEIRYWVRKIPSLTGKANHNILDDLVSEIPNFLFHLLELPEIDFTKSRMVFEADEIMTDALAVVKSESKSQLYKELHDIFHDLFSNQSSLTEIDFIPKDVKDEYYRTNSTVGTSYIRSVLKKEFNINTFGTRRYTPLGNGSIGGIGGSKVGDAFKLRREYFDNVDISEEDINDEPFTDPTKGNDTLEIDF
jgi:hypothetical protein